MTREKLADVLRFYQGHIAAMGIKPCESPEYPTHFGHLAHMCRTAADEFVPAGRVEKAMRWLGFVQGVLVCKDEFTLAQIKRHSAPGLVEDPCSPNWVRAG